MSVTAKHTLSGSPLLTHLTRLHHVRELSDSSLLLDNGMHRDC
jgi:hypothetical protein